MLGLIIRLDGQKSRRMQFSGAEIRIGASNTNDLALCDDPGILAEHVTLRAAPLEQGEPLQWDVVVHRGARVVLAEGSMPLRDGATARLLDGTRIQVGGFSLELARDLPARPITEVERQLLVSIANGDDQSRDIYADWLEQHGEPVKAEYLRLQQEVFANVNPTATKRAAFAQASHRLRDLTSRLDEGWRRALARPIIEACDVSIEVPCPMDWASLAKTDRADVRACSACNKHVYYCDTVTDAREHASWGHCVVVDLVQLRKPRDLESHRPVMMMGAPRRIDR